MKLGIFGGTFDPPHAGHLAAACAARDALRLERVDLIPSNIPPHRRPPGADAEDRLAMVALAIEGEARLAASPREIRRGGVSYTFETLQELAVEDSALDLHLVLGADAYDELPTWREAGLLRELAHWILLPRPGGCGASQLRAEDRPRLLPPDQSPPPGHKAVYAVDMPPVPAAARDIRARLARGADPGAVLAPHVFEYIRRRGLYGWPTGDSHRG